MTPAKLADVMGRLNTVELTFAQAKLRARREPANQAHVTNAKDDPLQMAADAATAVRLGFAEIETTVRVARNARLNAIGCQVGAAVSRRRHAGAVLGRGGRGAAPGPGRLHLLHRDRLGLRHRGRLHRRRRHALVQGLPGRGLCQPRPQGALHLRRRQRAADGHPRAKVVPLSRGTLPVPAARHGRPGHPERRHRRRAGRLYRAGRHVGDPGRERAGGPARPRMCVRQRHHPLALRDPARGQDHAAT